MVRKKEWIKDFLVGLGVFIIGGVVLHHITKNKNIPQVNQQFEIKGNGNVQNSTTGDNSPIIGSVNNTTVIKHNALDEVWDFEKDIRDRGGFYDWQIGLDDGKLKAVRWATDSTVAAFGSELLNMNYNSKEDYYKRGGQEAFRNFIEKNK